jgi:hypothetical protein
MAAVNIKRINDWIRTEASPYVRLFGAALSNNITASPAE